MPVPKGTPKTPGSGRKKGAPNKLTFQARQVFEQQKYDPLIKMIEDAKQEQDPVRRLKLNKELLPYIHPKLSTVTHQGNDDSPIQITVQYGSAK